mgnify:CR=1 FL=1
MRTAACHSWPDRLEHVVENRRAAVPTIGKSLT